MKISEPRAEVATATSVSNQPLDCGSLSRCLTRARHQKRQHCSYNEECRYVTIQMSHMFGIGQRLQRHDAAVYNAGPDREPNQAAVSERVSRCDDQEHAERRIDA